MIRILCDKQDMNESKQEKQTDYAMGLTPPGPVDVTVLAFAEARLDGSALAELKRQTAAGTIQVLDIIILFKDEDGECWRIKISDLPPEQAAAVDFIEFIAADQYQFRRWK